MKPTTQCLNDSIELGFPQISYFATVPQLSDRRQFPSFFRTIPSDVFQVQGLVRLMQHFGWSWLGLLASEDDYGQMGSQILQKELLQSGACLAFHETVPLLYDKRKIQRIVQVNTVQYNTMTTGEPFAKMCRTCLDKVYTMVAFLFGAE